jgi:predicted tellurium resistance membrane protein TerC
MDLAFSVDSILTALAVSDEVWVVLLGGMIGILLMRGVATFFISLMNRVPELETTAYFLILFIAVKMGLTLLNFEIPNEMFIVVLVVAFVITFIVHGIRKNRAEKLSH